MPGVRIRVVVDGAMFVRLSLCGFVVASSDPEMVSPSPGSSSGSVYFEAIAPEGAMDRILAWIDNVRKVPRVRVKAMVWNSSIERPFIAGTVRVTAAVVEYCVLVCSPFSVVSTSLPALIVCVITSDVQRCSSTPVCGSKPWKSQRSCSAALQRRRLT